MASESWQEAWVAVLPDFKQFKSQANRQMTDILGSAGSAGGVAAGNNIGGGILGGIKGIAGPLVGVLAGLGIGRLIGEAIGSGINYAFDAVDLASDLNESFNAVQVTFGEQIADDLKALAAQAPKDLKVTQKTFNEFATRFSAFGKTVVGEGGDVVKFIDDLTTRGADFASVYNLDVADALALFQSGLAGETEPLRRYGIDLSAASVEAYAYASGIATAGEELTEAEKVQARYAALLAQTSAVQGDAAATSGELAGQQREFAVALEEAQTGFGEALLPIATELLTFANSEVIPELKDFLTEMGPELADGLKDALPDIKTLLTELADAAPVLADFANATLPLIIQGMRDIVEILTGFPGWNEFLGIPAGGVEPFSIPGTTPWKPTGDVLGFGQDPAAEPGTPFDFFGGGGSGGGGGGAQFTQNNTFSGGLSEGNAADLAADRVMQLLRRA